MIINHKVAVGTWDYTSMEAGKPNPEVISSVEVDGVVVTFENPDERGLVVTTVGGDTKTNRRILGLWAKCFEEPRPRVTEGGGVDMPIGAECRPKEARDLFVAWLVKNSPTARKRETVVVNK